MNLKTIKVDIETTKYKNAFKLKQGEIHSNQILFYDFPEKINLGNVCEIGYSFAEVHRTNCKKKLDADKVIMTIVVIKKKAKKSLEVTKNESTLINKTSIYSTASTPSGSRIDFSTKRNFDEFEPHTVQKFLNMCPTQPLYNKEIDDNIVKTIKNLKPREKSVLILVEPMISHGLIASNKSKNSNEEIIEFFTNKSVIEKSFELTKVCVRTKNNIKKYIPIA